jgi:hypothetical protein
MAKEQDDLYRVVSAFLDDCDACLDKRKSGNSCVWYGRMERCLDAINRKASDIIPAPRIGRPPKG